MPTIGLHNNMNTLHECRRPPQPYSVQVTSTELIVLHCQAGPAIILSTPLGGVQPLTFGDTPGYTLPAPPLQGLHVIIHVCSKEIILFRISGVTFEVSSCTKF